MKNFLRQHYPLLILLFLSLVTRFVFLSFPAEVVFDEVHFGKFISAYFTHQYYFDIHPPLGKLMIAGAAQLFGFQPGLGFEKIGEAGNAWVFLALRFLPALFGSLFVLIIYQLVVVLGGSKRAGFLAGFLVLFDNAFLVESKFILVDSFLFFFGFASLLIFLISRKQANRLKKHLLYFASMALAALAFSIKWTGLAFWGIILLFSFISFLRDVSTKRLPKFLMEMVVSSALFALVYTLPFIIHFNLLAHSGPGDAFMSLDFQKTLIGNSLGPETKPLSFWSKFSELNQSMFSYNSGLKKEHPDSSQWYQWPFLEKPVWYWVKNAEGESANIYLWGNPAVWFSGLTGLLLGVWFLLKERKFAVFFLLFGYLANFLPFVFVGRVAFLYHYLPALVFSLILFAVLTDRFFNHRSPFFYFSYLSLVLASFLVIAPLSYGFFINPRFSSALQLLIRLFH